MGKSSGKSGWLGLAAKLGAKAFGLLKAGKVLLAGGSIAAYTWLFTWQFALIILGMAVIHESGHLWFMKRYRMKTKGIYLIPFLGAAAVAEDRFPSRRAEAVIAIAGPATGGVLALGAAGLYLVTRDGYYAAVASWFALVNLFNLLPVVPLDGGRILKSVTCSTIGSRIGTAAVVGGMLLGALLAFTANLWIFVILLPLGVLDFFGEAWAARRKERCRQERLAGINASLAARYPRATITPLAELPGDPAPKVMPTMAGRSLALAFAGYAALAVCLWLLMLAMSAQPGAAAAMHALQG